MKQIALKYLAEGYESLGIERGYHITEVYGGKAENPEYVCSEK